MMTGWTLKPMGNCGCYHTKPPLGNNGVWLCAHCGRLWTSDDASKIDPQWELVVLHQIRDLLKQRDSD